MTLTKRLDDGRFMWRSDSGAYIGITEEQLLDMIDQVEAYKEAEEDL